MAHAESAANYYQESRLIDLARMIENAASVAGQIGPVRAVFSGADEQQAVDALKQLAAMLGTGAQIIDIDAVYKQYGGEAESHLEQILGQAMAEGSILMFDGIDACFGRNPYGSGSTVGHARLDQARFMNLLARYRVPVVICSQTSYLLDTAILRTFSCVIDFEDGLLPARAVPGL